MAKKNSKRKNFFPYGIFFIIFIAEIFLGLSAISAYLFFDGKREVDLLESDIKKYSSSLAEAFAHVAELSIKDKQYQPLRNLFQEKIAENIIDEAFFVLADGRLVVHSNIAIEKELSGNIAKDEMSYNIDLILKPLRDNSHEILISDYNIIKKEPYFKKNIRDLIKKYFYKGIESNGWLFSKAVFVKSKPIGTVNFILSKDRIFYAIKNIIERARRLTAIVLLMSFLLSLLISLFVMLRDLSRNKKQSTIDSSAKEKFLDLPEIDVASEKENLQIELIDDSLESADSPEITVIGHERYIVAPIIPEYRAHSTGRRILDAIPSENKRKR